MTHAVSIPNSSAPTNTLKSVCSDAVHWVLTHRLRPCASLHSPTKAISPLRILHFFQQAIQSRTFPNLLGEQNQGGAMLESIPDEDGKTCTPAHPHETHITLECVVIANTCHIYPYAVGSTLGHAHGRVNCVRTYVRLYMNMSNK